MSTPDKILAWHFLPDDSKTRYSREAVQVGTTLHVEKIAICNSGLHASIHPLDALKYAPGFLLCRVELSGEKEQQEDKLCAQTRTVLAMQSSRRLVLEFTADVVAKVFGEVGLGGEDCDTVCKFVRDFAASGSMNGLEAAQRAASKILDLDLDRDLDRARDRALDRNNQSKIYAWARDEFQNRVEALFA